MTIDQYAFQLDKAKRYMEDKYPTLSEFECTVIAERIAHAKAEGIIVGDLLGTEGKKERATYKYDEETMGRTKAKLEQHFQQCPADEKGGEWLQAKEIMERISERDDEDKLLYDGAFQKRLGTVLRTFGYARKSVRRGDSPTYCYYVREIQRPAIRMARTYLTEAFTPSMKGEPRAEFLTCTQIMSRIAMRMNIPDNQLGQNFITELGGALKMEKYEKVMHGKVRGYWVRSKP